MAGSILLILIITVGGSAITYLIDRDERLMWRLAAGSVIGSAVCGTAAFIFGSLAGLNQVTAGLSIIFVLSPAILYFSDRYRKLLALDWARAKGKVQGTDLGRALRFGFYAFWIILFLTFFGRAMFEAPDGIYTGNANNLGDLPYHLGAIFSFTDGANFPPENPSFAGTTFSYPFVADLLTAVFMKLGTSLREAMFIQNVVWALSLLVILERFVFKLTADRLASRFAPWILFLSGGFGFLWFFSDFAAQGHSLSEFLWNLTKDYTIGDFRWGNSLTTLFMTQRSLLLGLPLTLVVLGVLWRYFAEERRPEEISETLNFKSGLPLSIFLAGLLAGLLPLVHLHSLAVLFVVGVFLLVLCPERWRAWMIFAAGVAVLAVPELIWSLAGSASETSKFIEWHFGWDKGEQNFFWFWFMNTGLFVPILVFGACLVWKRSATDAAESPENVSKKRRVKKETNVSSFAVDRTALLKFYLPFLFLFVAANAVKLAPWEWDNIKVLIYWFVASIPFVAYALAWMWQKGGPLAAAAVVCLIVLTGSGALDVWRVASGQQRHRVFERDAIIVAERIKRATAPNSLFLNAPTYNSAIVLTGRPSLMRYTGHLMSHGIDYAEREAEVKKIYQGGPEADQLLAEYGIEYVLISPEERNLVSPNEAFFRKFPVIAEADQYRVYKVR